jgi:hypothetical protein
MEKGTTLTWMGGLGNQIWSLVAAYVTSRVQGCPLYLPENPAKNNPHLTEGINYLKTIFQHFGTHISESQESFHARLKAVGWRCPSPSQNGFHPWRPEETHPGTILDSYYQYWPAIKGHETEIRALLLQGLAEIRERLETAYEFDGAAFLHIRRGDYLDKPTIHFSQPQAYYDKAIRLLKEEGRVKRIYVLTEDPKWAAEQSFVKDSDGLLTVVDIPNELDSIAFMSLCTAGAIIANSTFSWWGAFLGAWGGRSTVIAPQLWISYRVVSLIPEEWIVLDKKQKILPRLAEPNTVCVTLSDAAYMDKAVRTIQELRGAGRWDGDVVLLCVDCNPPAGIAERYNVIMHRIPKINTDLLVQALKENPIRPMPDGRHFGKLTQWTKFRVFDPFFKRWDRVAFFDAGLRIFDTIEPILQIPWRGRFIAPDDAGVVDNGNRFRVQLDLAANPRVAEDMIAQVGKGVLDERYFLNCMWIYDTALLDRISVEDLEDSMNRYPISLCNEMGIMNYWFSYKLRCWSPLPWRTPTGKIVFAWSEGSLHGGTSWSDFHFVKYSSTA